MLPRIFVIEFCMNELIVKSIVINIETIINVKPTLVNIRKVYFLFLCRIIYVGVIWYKKNLSIVF